MIMYLYLIFFNADGGCELVVVHRMNEMGIERVER